MANKLIQNSIVFFCTILFGFFLFSQLQDGKWWLIPMPIIISLVTFFSFRLDKLLILIILCAPLSLSLGELGFFVENTDISFPTEFLLFSLTCVCFFKIIYTPKFFEKTLANKITFFLLAYLVWMFTCSITSTMPFVSLKLFLTRLGDEKYFKFPFLTVSSFSSKFFW